MHDLDPRKLYTKEEFKEYTKEKGINTLKHLFKHGDGHYNGQIINTENDKYFLYPELIPSFEKHF